MCLIASCPVVDAIIAVVQVIITLDNVDVVAANKSLILVHDNYIYPHTCMHVQKHCYAILLNMYFVHACMQLLDSHVKHSPPFGPQGFFRKLNSVPV